METKAESVGASARLIGKREGRGGGPKDRVRVRRHQRAPWPSRSGGARARRGRPPPRVLRSGIALEPIKAKLLLFGGISDLAHLGVLVPDSLDARDLTKHRHRDNTLLYMLVLLTFSPTTPNSSQGQMRKIFWFFVVDVVVVVVGGCAAALQLACAPESPTKKNKTRRSRAPPEVCPYVHLLLLLVVHLLAAAQLARTTGGDQADLLTGHRVAAHRRGVANVLVVTTTVRVLDGVHRHTTHLRPRVALGLVLVERPARLEHGLVHTAAARDNANGGARKARDGLLLTRRQAHTRLTGALDVANDLREAARRLGELALVALVLLKVVDHSTGRHVLKRHHVAGHELGCDAHRRRGRGAQSEGERCFRPHGIWQSRRGATSCRKQLLPPHHSMSRRDESERARHIVSRSNFAAIGCFQAVISHSGNSSSDRSSLGACLSATAAAASAPALSALR